MLLSRAELTLCVPTHVCAFLLWLQVILRRIVVREEQKSLHNGKVPLDGMREWDPLTAWLKQRGECDSAPCPCQLAFIDQRGY